MFPTVAPCTSNKAPNVIHWPRMLVDAREQLAIDQHQTRSRVQCCKRACILSWRNQPKCYPTKTDLRSAKRLKALHQLQHLPARFPPSRTVDSDQAKGGFPVKMPPLHCPDLRCERHTLLLEEASYVRGLVAPSVATPTCEHEWPFNDSQVFHSLPTC